MQKSGLTEIIPLICISAVWGASQVVLAVKNLPANTGDQVWFLGREDLLEEGTANYYSILVWRIPWTEYPGELWPIGSQRVSHKWSDLAVKTFSSIILPKHTQVPLPSQLFPLTLGAFYLFSMLTFCLFQNAPQMETYSF